MTNRTHAAPSASIEPTPTAMQQLADRLAIADLNHRFADAITRMDVAACASMFTEDAEIVVTNWDTFAGRDEILRSLRELLSGWRGIVFTNHSGVAEIDGDAATGQWYIREFGIKFDEEFDISGVYHDTYRRTDGRWQFSSRRYDTLHLRRAGEIAVTRFPAELGGVGGDHDERQP
ncbi:MAG: nuclear transport factor 2 family protein [Ilumatobacteraceae bacterium]